MNKRLWILEKNKAMKKGFRHLLAYLFFCLAMSVIRPAASFAQTPPQGFICDSVSPSSSAQLAIAAYQLQSCLEEVADIDSAKKLVQTLNLDVIKFFDLTRLYDTETKQNDYKKTKEYKDNLAQLTLVKAEKLKHYYYSVLTTNLGSYSWAFKGFKFDMDKLTTPGGVIGIPPPPSTILYDIELRSLPFEITNSTDQDIKLPVLPDSGMSILRNKNDIMTIVFYKLGNVFAKEYSYFNAQCHCNRNAKEDVITTKYDRVIIFNVKTNDIYWDVFYDKP